MLAYFGSKLYGTVFTPLRLLHGPWTRSMHNPCRLFFHCSRDQFKNKIMDESWKYRARY